MSSLNSRIVLHLLAMVIVLSGLFAIFFNNQQQEFLENQLLREARGLYHYVVRTCRWISRNRGVYVMDRGTSDSYILYTPSKFIKSVSDFRSDDEPFALHLVRVRGGKFREVSDTFEKNALEQLVRGESDEVWEISGSGDSTVFNYAGPLYFGDDCAGCHAGTHPEKVVGSFVLSIPADRLVSDLENDRIFYLGYMGAVLFVIVSFLWIMIRTYVVRPLEKLRGAYEDVRQGKLETRIKLDVSSEWREVGESFNQMVNSVATQHTRLESEIEKAFLDLQKAYENLKKTGQYRHDFFSNITHDLKTPITAIKGVTELLSNNISEGENATYVAILERNVEKLSKLVRDLIDLARIESGEFDLELKKCDFAEIVEDAILMVMPLAMKKGIAFNYSVPREEALIRGDYDRLEQTVSNLLSNAIKFSPEGSMVNIRLEQESGQIVLSVEDHGPGIPDDDKERVFEKFFRRGKSMVEGTGLGLAIARGIVAAHGGTMWITDPEHRGTVFHVALPLYSDI